MQCQNCNQPATVHLTEIINGEKIEKHLCEACAKKAGIPVNDQAPLAEALLGHLIAVQKETRDVGELTCPECQMTWSRFRKSGLLGCPNDYQVFAKPLSSLIRQAHEQAEVHTGRVPHGHQQKADSQAMLLRLRNQLEQAVQTEDYETAARLRDEIGHLMQ